MVFCYENLNRLIQHKIKKLKNMINARERNGNTAHNRKIMGQNSDFVDQNMLLIVYLL